MLNLEQIKEKLEGENLSQLSIKIKMPHKTLYDIKNGTNKNPTYNTILKLSEYFK